MIQRSTSLERRLEHETVRHAGSLAMLIFYKGEMPSSCDLAAAGERVESTPAAEAVIRGLMHGTAPTLPPEATYWRLLDNNGNVVMQGDCRE